jgi:hypothetical protein
VAGGWRWPGTIVERERDLVLPSRPLEDLRAAAGAAADEPWRVAPGKLWACRRSLARRAGGRCHADGEQNKQRQERAHSSAQETSIALSPPHAAIFARDSDPHKKGPRWRAGPRTSRFSSQNRGSGRGSRCGGGKRHHQLVHVRRTDTGGGIPTGSGRVTSDPTLDPGKVTVGKG